MYQVFAESDDENANDNASDDPEAKDDHLSKEGTDIAKPMPVSNETSSNADVVTSSKAGKDPDGEKDQTCISDVSEDMIKEAIEKRAPYFRKNSGYVSPISCCMYNYRKFMLRLLTMFAMCWFTELLKLCRLI